MNMRMGMGCFVIGVLPAVAEPVAEPDVGALLQQILEQVEDQGRKIDRIYRAGEPFLNEWEAEAEQWRREQAEDEILCMERIAEIRDHALLNHGCGNPAAPEFFALTSIGGVCTYDAAGEPGQEFRQANEYISVVACSPDGATLAAGTKSGKLLLWDRTRDECTVLATNAGKQVSNVTWIGNDKLAWGHGQSYWGKDSKPINREIQNGAVLDRATGKTLWTFQSSMHDRDRCSISGSADGKWLAVMELIGHPRGAFVLDAETGEILQVLYDQAHGCGPLSIAFAPDGHTVAVGYAPRDIILWDTQTGEQRRMLEGHSNWVVSLAFSANSKRLISGAGDSSVRVWDLNHWKEIGRLRFSGQSTYTWSVGISPDGRTAFALTRPGQLTVARVPEE